MAETLSVVDRALAEEAKELTLAEEAVAASDIQKLQAQVRRLIGERTTLAKGFHAVTNAMSILREEPSNDSIAALERVATDAIALSRELAQALIKK